MVNIRELLEKRNMYPVSTREDEWIKESLESDEEELWLVVLSGFINSQRAQPEINALTEIYYIAGIYNLGSPFLNTGVRYELLHLVKHKVDAVDIGIFRARMFDVRPSKRYADEFNLADNYSIKYSAYISELEKWINEGITPDHDREGEYEYNTIPMYEFSYSHISPEFYSRIALDVRNLLHKEKTVPLGSVADVILPRPIRDKDGKVLFQQDLKYPLDTNSLSIKQISSVTIQKKDILFPTVGNGKPYLVTEDIDEDIYANMHMAVIRCRQILPEYLYLYLISEVCQVIIETLSTGVAIKRITLATLKSIPVIIPKEPASVYELQVQALTHKEKVYNKTLSDQMKRLFAYHCKTVALSKKQPEKKIEDILNIETAQKIKLFDEENVRSFLTSDLKELNDCFRVKAYKATLILAGSILEAVLIDWLSDIKGVNYFEEDYIITDRKTGRQKKADLIDYINEIKYIERPHWMEEASKAHEIRKKRNLVHAKLCIKSDEINENICKQVIEYLKDVLKTRGVVS